MSYRRRLKAGKLQDLALQVACAAARLEAEGVDPDAATNLRKAQLHLDAAVRQVLSEST